MEGLLKTLRERASQPRQATGPGYYQPQLGLTPYPQGPAEGLIDLARALGQYTVQRRHEAFETEEQAKAEKAKTRAEAGARIKFAQESGFSLQEILANPSLKADLESLLGAPWPTVETPAVLRRKLKPTAPPKLKGLIDLEPGATLEEPKSPELEALKAAQEEVEEVEVVTPARTGPYLPGARAFPQLRSLLERDPNTWTPEEAAYIQKMVGTEGVRRVLGIDATEGLGDQLLGNIIPGVDPRFANIPLRYASSVIANLMKEPTQAETFTEWSKDAQARATAILKAMSASSDPAIRQALATQYNNIAFYLNQANIKTKYISREEAQQLPRGVQSLIDLRGQQVEASKLLSKLRWEQLTREQRGRVSDIVVGILGKVRATGIDSLTSGEREIWNNYIAKSRGATDKTALYIREASWITGILGDPVKRRQFEKQDPGRIERMTKRLQRLMTLIEGSTGTGPAGGTDEVAQWIKEQLKVPGMTLDEIKAELVRQGIDSDDYADAFR